MDDAPQTEHGAGLAGLIAPVGRRVLGRHARLMRATGLRLGEAVAARHETPEAAKAARRLAPVRLVTRTPAARPTAAAPEPAAGSWEPSTTESTVMPGMSDWAAEYLFGDADTAVSTGQAWMGGAGLQPRTPEERRLSRIKRGGPEVARAAKILEGDETPPPPPAGAKRLARRPASDAGAVSGPIRTTDNPASAPAPAATGATRETTAAADEPASTPAARETSRPTVARAASETPSAPGRDIAADASSRPTVARSPRQTPPTPASEPAAGASSRPASEPAAGASSRPTVARSPRETPGAAPSPLGETASVASPRAEPAGGETSRPTVARVARVSRETPASLPSEPAAGGTSGPGSPAAETASGEISRPMPPAAETASRGNTESASPAAEIASGPSARPTVTRVARETPASRPSELAVDDRSTGETWSAIASGSEAAARVPVSRAPARGRPTVQRVARPEPALVPAAPPAPPAPAPTLFRRIADRFRSSAPAAPTEEPPPMPRAAVTRLARMDLQPTAPAPPVSETPAIRGTNPERLARMLGTEVAHDEQGNATVSMPDYVPFSTAPRTVSRAETTEAPSPPPTASPASTTPSLPQQTGAEPSATVDMDAVAETVIDKLRRELLVEREQAGGPMDLI